MLAGKCPKCGTSYYGWALRFPRHQACPNCGIGLEIAENGRCISKGYSPFTAEEHSVKPPTDAPADKAEKPHAHKE
ncbi:hypothetical protein ACFLTJ_03450 [Chloroflexota bacterium]